VLLPTNLLWIQIFLHFLSELPDQGDPRGSLQGLNRDSGPVISLRSLFLLKTSPLRYFMCVSDHCPAEMSIEEAYCPL
jgi:hypothetical protein